jgi:hypothetical protein
VPLRGHRQSPLRPERDEGPRLGGHVRASLAQMEHARDILDRAINEALETGRLRTSRVHEAYRRLAAVLGQYPGGAL